MNLGDYLVLGFDLQKHFYTKDNTATKKYVIYMSNENEIALKKQKKDINHKKTKVYVILK